MFNSWKEFFNIETKKPYYQSLMAQVDWMYQLNELFPAQKDLFRAFCLCDYNDLKVVILGQDPYHNENQANGLAFSVNKGILLPPSLKNIFLEIQNEYGYLRSDPDLSDWAQQGVLLLNTTLTVVKHQPLSCQNWGWETFTQDLLMYLNQHKSGIIYVCWGNHAYNTLKKAGIDESRNTILYTSHPSPLSAHRGFLGSDIFKKINDALIMQDKKTINW